MVITKRQLKRIIMEVLQEDARVANSDLRYESLQPITTLGLQVVTYSTEEGKMLANALEQIDIDGTAGETIDPDNLRQIVDYYNRPEAYNNYCSGMSQRFVKLVERTLVKSGRFN